MPEALPVDEARMREALAEAQAAAAVGDVPVGALVVDADGTVLARGRNAARRLGRWRLESVTFYATLEPCPMCAGALVNARIARLVYGCPDPKAGAVDTLFSIGRDGRLNHRFDITAGVLADESAALLRAFFAELRTGSGKR